MSAETIGEPEILARAMPLVEYDTPGHGLRVDLARVAVPIFKAAEPLFTNPVVDSKAYRAHWSIVKTHQYVQAFGYEAMRAEEPAGPVEFAIQITAPAEEGTSTDHASYFFMFNATTGEDLGSTRGGQVDVFGMQGRDNTISNEEVIALTRIMQDAQGI